MNPTLQNHIHDTFGNIITSKPLSGGDISTVYHIQTTNADLVAKVTPTYQQGQLLTAEAKGLNLLAKQNTIAVPDVYELTNLDEVTALIMAYVPTKPVEDKDMVRLGQDLAALHQCMGTQYGLKHDNFIGVLPQSNQSHNRWAEFYTNERLLPQFKTANENGLLNSSEIPKVDIIIDTIKQYTEHTEPTLLHGDLWRGNYLIHEDGTPFLIDPAIYYGHSAVDIAMTKLFGGFSKDFYEAYHEIIPDSSNAQVQIDLYQLYYLLAHLNMFGLSYKGSVIQIVNRYFR